MFDADLYGIPLQIIIGDKSLVKGCVEIKNRQSGEVVEVGVGDVESVVKDFQAKLF
jgi:prolyl-tRNA synthetase